MIIKQQSRDSDASESSFRDFRVNVVCLFAWNICSCARLFARLSQNMYVQLAKEIKIINSPKELAFKCLADFISRLENQICG